MREIGRTLATVSLLAVICPVLGLPAYAQTPTPPTEAPDWPVQALTQETPQAPADATPTAPPPTPAIVLPAPTPIVIVATPTPTPVLTTVTAINPVAIPIPPPAEADKVELIPFQWLGQGEQSLYGPFDSATYSFSLPAHWQLSEGAQVELDLFHSISGFETPLYRPMTYPVFGTVDVYFNDKLVATISLDWSGERTVNVPIPAQALTPTTPDGRHRLLLVLNAGFECEPIGELGAKMHTTVAVRATSRFFAPHTLVAPITDLRLLPWPIFQQSFLPDAAVVVVPNQPTAKELQAALAVAAGFGQTTNGRLSLSLVPAGQLSREMRDTSHLIFIGKSGTFPMLGEVGLPVVAAAPGDGAIQMANSPWNVAKVILFINGQSDEAVVKAAQAISTGSILVAGQSNLALVTQVLPQPASDEPVPADRTLTQLGYSTVQMSGVGMTTTRYRFDVPAGQTASGDAYLDLIFSHSGFMDYGESGLSIRLNDQSVGSVDFDEQSSTLKKARISLPNSAIRQGKNVLTIDAFLFPLAICTSYNMGGLWVAIQPDSTLHVPLAAAQPQMVSWFDLGKYPEPFTLNPILLGDTAFVLSPDDPISWSVAAQIAFDLGRAANKLLADLVVVFGDAVPEDVRQARHLLVVGRPSQLPLIGELNDVLPAPFAAGADTAMPQNDLQIDYQLPPGSSVGYIQLLPAPWSHTREILAVLGNTDEGLQWAGTALIGPKLRGRLVGNFAIIRGDQVVSSYLSRAIPTAQAVLTPVPGATLAEAMPTPIMPTGEIIASRPTWIVPVLIAATALMGVVILGVTIAALLRQ
jgi:hypothetical protein